MAHGWAVRNFLANLPTSGVAIRTSAVGNACKLCLAASQQIVPGQAMWDDCALIDSQSVSHLRSAESSNDLGEVLSSKALAELRENLRTDQCPASITPDCPPGASMGSSTNLSEAGINACRWFCICDSCNCVKGKLENIAMSAHFQATTTNDTSLFATPKAKVERMKVIYDSSYQKPQNTQQSATTCQTPSPTIVQSARLQHSRRLLEDVTGQCYSTSGWTDNKCNKLCSDEHDDFDACNHQCSGKCSSSCSCYTGKLDYILLISICIIVISIKVIPVSIMVISIYSSSLWSSPSRA